jgi:hypothetical protein
VADDLIHKQTIISSHEPGGSRDGVIYACNIRAPRLFTYDVSSVTCLKCIEQIKQSALPNLHLLVLDARRIANSLGADRPAVSTWLQEIVLSNERLRRAIETEMIQ